MIALNLSRIFKSRGIQKPYTFLVNAGFVPFMAHKLVNAKVQQVRLDHIELLCKVLHCTPNDLFEWMPDDLMDDDQKHPLQKIRKQNKKDSLNQLLAKVPLEKLEEIEKLLLNG